MPSVNILQEKSALSRLVETIEQGHERGIIIARNGRSAAKLVSMDSVPAAWSIGVAMGNFGMPDRVDVYNEESARMFWDGHS